MALNTLEAVESMTFTVTKYEQRLIKEDGAPYFAHVITLEETDTLTLSNTSYEFVQTEELTEAGIAVQPYGAILTNDSAPTQASGTTNYLYIKVDGVETLYKSSDTLDDIISGGVGGTVTFAPESDDSGDDSGDDSSDDT